MKLGRTGDVVESLLAGVTYAGLCGGLVALQVERAWNHRNDPRDKKTGDKKPVASSPLAALGKTIKLDLPPAAEEINPDFPELALLFKGFDQLNKYKQLANVFQHISDAASESDPRKALFNNAAYLTQSAGNIWFRNTSLAKVKAIQTFPADAVQLQQLANLFGQADTPPKLLMLLQTLEKTFKAQKRQSVAHLFYHTHDLLEKVLNPKKQPVELSPIAPAVPEKGAVIH